jgi:hypothetical protein
MTTNQPKKILSLDGGGIRGRVGHELDNEIKTLQGQLGEGCIQEKLFTYLRYNFDIDLAGFLPPQPR